MKIYASIVTVISVLLLALSGYLYIQNSEVQQCKQERDSFAQANIGFQGQVDHMEQQMKKINVSAVLFKSIVNSFMYAGDIKALNIGLTEGAEVEKNIQNLTDSMDRMSAEKDWGDFKNTLGFNPVFGLLRNLANSMVQNSEISNNPPMDKSDPTDDTLEQSKQ